MKTRKDGDFHGFLLLVYQEGIPCMITRKTTYFWETPWAPRSPGGTSSQVPFVRCHRVIRASRQSKDVMNTFFFFWGGLHYSGYMLLDYFFLNLKYVHMLQTTYIYISMNPLKGLFSTILLKLKAASHL